MRPVEDAVYNFTRMLSSPTAKQPRTWGTLVNSAAATVADFNGVVVSNPTASGLTWVVAVPQVASDVFAVWRFRQATLGAIDTIVNGNHNDTPVTAHALSGMVDETDTQAVGIYDVVLPSTYNAEDPGGGGANERTWQAYGVASTQPLIGAFWIPSGRGLLISHVTAITPIEMTIVAHEIS